MATTTCYQYSFNEAIPLDGTLYRWFGPDLRFGLGAVTVSAIPGGLSQQYIEVVQMGTRREAGIDNRYFLDIVFRNNGHVGGAGTTINSYRVYISVTTP